MMQGNSRQSGESLPPRAYYRLESAALVLKPYEVRLLLIAPRRSVFHWCLRPFRWRDGLALALPLFESCM